MIVKIPNVIGISVITLLLFERVTVKVGGGIGVLIIQFSRGAKAAHAPVLAPCRSRSLLC